MCVCDDPDADIILFCCYIAPFCVVCVFSSSTAVVSTLVSLISAKKLTSSIKPTIRTPHIHNASSKTTLRYPKGSKTVFRLLKVPKTHVCSTRNDVSVRELTPTRTLLTPKRTSAKRLRIGSQISRRSHHQDPSNETRFATTHWRKQDITNEAILRHRYHEQSHE